jgi:hypothetical protein
MSEPAPTPAAGPSLERVLGRPLLRREPPDLHALILAHSGYSKISPEAWAEYDRAMKGMERGAAQAEQGGEAMSDPRTSLEIIRERPSEDEIARREADGFVMMTTLTGEMAWVSESALEASINARPPIDLAAVRAGLARLTLEDLDNEGVDYSSVGAVGDDISNRLLRDEREQTLLAEAIGCLWALGELGRFADRDTGVEDEAAGRLSERCTAATNLLADARPEAIEMALERLCRNGDFGVAAGAVWFLAIGAAPSTTQAAASGAATPR